jgi:SAM-dependent methyltransferase
MMVAEIAAAGHACAMAEESSWVDTMPDFYDRCLGPALFTPWAQHLAAVAAGHAPDSVLEIAAGSGILTAELVRRLPTAQLTATDLNPAMVSWGAQRVSGPTWLAADAQRLQFSHSSFDMVICQFGVMFFPDKAAAFDQVADVLRPGGVFVFSVWDAVEESLFPAALVSGLADVFPDEAPDFVARIPHGYHDPDEIASDLDAGGLVLDQIERVVLRGKATSAGTLAEGFCKGTPLRFALQQRGDVHHLTEAVADRMTARLGSGPVDGDLAGFVVSARRPAQGSTLTTEPGVGQR